MKSFYGGKADLADAGVDPKMTRLGHWAYRLTIMVTTGFPRPASSVYGDKL